MSSQTALIVDDSKLARITLQRLLERRGFQVTTAGSAAEALEILKQQPLPDIVFMDHLMPEMDGFEAMKRIKADPSISHLPVVMCTGKEGGDEYSAQAKAIGAATALSKPPETDQLNAVIAEALVASNSAQAPQAPAEEEIPVISDFADVEPLFADEIPVLSEATDVEPAFAEEIPLVTEMAEIQAEPEDEIPLVTEPAEATPRVDDGIPRVSEPAEVSPLFDDHIPLVSETADAEHRLEDQTPRDFEAVAMNTASEAELPTVSETADRELLAAKIPSYTDTGRSEAESSQDSQPEAASPVSGEPAITALREELLTNCINPLNEQITSLQDQLTREIERLQLTTPRVEDIEARVLSQINAQPATDPTELADNLTARLNTQLQYHEQHVQAEISALTERLHQELQNLQPELQQLHQKFLQLDSDVARAAESTAQQPDYATLENRAAQAAVAAAEDTLNVLIVHRMEQMQNSLQAELAPLREQLEALQQAKAAQLSGDQIQQLAHQAVSTELEQASNKLIARITTALREKVEETQNELQTRQERFEQEIQERQDLFEQECSIQQHQMQDSRKNLLWVSGLSLLVSIGAVVAAVML